MLAAMPRRWEDLDPETRDLLDAQYLEELASWNETALTDEGVRAYLAYRHERPGAAITTYEEGRIRRMLHRMTDPSRLPDPVEQEEHLDALEVFGARYLHLTNEETYGAVLFVLVFGALVVLLASLLAS